MKRCLWEILVPRKSNDGSRFPLGHHHAWDDKVRNLCGGLTVLKPAKGQWVSPNNELFRDSMIPVRIYCTARQIELVAEHTMRHYDQLAVMYYCISDNVVIYNGFNHLPPPRR